MCTSKLLELGSGDLLGLGLPRTSALHRSGGHFPWVLVWVGAYYWHGVGGFVFNSSSSGLPRTTIPAAGGARELVQREAFIIIIIIIIAQ